MSDNGELEDKPPAPPVRMSSTIFSSGGKDQSCTNHSLKPLPSVPEEKKPRNKIISIFSGTEKGKILYFVASTYGFEFLCQEVELLNASGRCVFFVALKLDTEVWEGDFLCGKCNSGQAASLFVGFLHSRGRGTEREVTASSTMVPSAGRMQLKRLGGFCFLSVSRME